MPFCPIVKQQMASDFAIISRGDTVWQPAQKQQEYKIICHIEKTERQAWMEAVDCKHGKQSMVRSEYIAMTQNGYPVKKMQQAAQTLRDYMEEQGWREAP